MWLAYQLNKPSDKTGIVVAFRRKDNLSETLSVKLKGLNHDSNYTIFNTDTNEQIIKTGKELEQGLILKIKETPGTVLIKYHAD